MILLYSWYRLTELVVPVFVCFQLCYFQEVGEFHPSLGTNPPALKMSDYCMWGYPGKLSYNKELAVLSTTCRYWWPFNSNRPKKSLHRVIWWNLIVPVEWLVASAVGVGVFDSVTLFHQDDNVFGWARPENWGSSSQLALFFPPSYLGGWW